MFSKIDSAINGFTLSSLTFGVAHSGPKIVDQPKPGP